MILVSRAFKGVIKASTSCFSPTYLSAIAAIFVALSSAECTRAGLHSAASSYLAAQTAGKPSTLALSTSNFTYQQNNKVSDISKGLLSTPYTITLNRTSADSVACASYTMWISTSGAKPFVVSTQIRHANNDTSSISMIDTVAATTGDLFFDAKKTLGYIQKEDWSEVPDGRRPSRALLKKVGDAYLDMWTDKSAADSIPWGTECERVEGSRCYLFVWYFVANIKRLVHQPLRQISPERWQC
jgi:hypothetical protein